MKATIIFISDIIFALVQYHMISFLHCYFSGANCAIESILLTFCLLFSAKITKSESDKLQLTFRPGLTSFSTRRQMKMTS